MFTNPAPRLGWSGRRGATHAPWPGPPDFSVVRMEGLGWLRLLSALNCWRGLRAVCPRRKKLLQFWLIKKKKKLSGRTFPVQASGCRLRREALECSFPLGVSSVFGEGKRFDYVMDLARTPDLSDLEKTLKKLLPLFLVQTISQPSPQFPVSCGAGQAVLHLIQ